MKKIIALVFIFVLICPSFSFGADYKSWTKKRLGIGTGHGNSQISADGKYLVVAKREGPLHTGTFWLMKTKSKKPVWKYENKENIIFDLKVSQNGDYIAAVGGKIWFFSKKSNKPLWLNNLDVSVMDTVAMTPDGKYIVTGDRFGEVFLFKKESRIPIKSWWIGKNKDSDRDVNKIAISSNGKYIALGSQVGVSLIDRDKNKVLWQYRTKREKEYGGKTYQVSDAVMNLSMSQSGKYFAATTEDNNLYLFDKDKKGKPKWSYHQDSFHTTSVWVSGNGKYLTFSTNDKYLGFSVKNNTPIWTFDLDGRQTDLAMSTNGKYIVVADALDYLYLFDLEYGSSQRPFRIYEGVFPDEVTLTNAGDKLAYDERDFHYQEVVPGVLSDLQDKVKAYTKGSEMHLRMFATNPGKSKKLNLKVKLSLPQISLWQTVGDQIGDSNVALVPKFLAKLFGEPEGYIVYNKDYTFEAQKSRDLKEVIEMPALDEPDWYSSFFLGFDLIGKLISELGDVLKKVLPDAVAEGIVSSLNIAVQGGQTIFPTIGLGTVTLSDPQTGEVLDQDTFTFAFIIS